MAGDLIKCDVQAQSHIQTDSTPGQAAYSVWQPTTNLQDVVTGGTATYGETFTQQIASSGSVADLGQLVVGGTLSTGTPDEKITEPQVVIRGAFEVFTTLYTYYYFAHNQLGMSNAAPASVYHPTAKSSYAHSYGLKGRPGFGISPDKLAADVKVVGHEYGHFCADQDGFLTRSVGGDHNPDQNQRSMPDPSTSAQLQKTDAQLAFNEGYADWFAVSGAVHGPTTGMGALAGLGEGQATIYGGNDFNSNSARGGGGAFSAGGSLVSGNCQHPQEQTKYTLQGDWLLSDDMVNLALAC
jgi:predicted outer membrane repeat protein